MSRASDLERFYAILDDLAAKLGPSRRLTAYNGRMGWPSHGVYFFFEVGEIRSDGRPRVVRVGTHALTQTSRTKLWNRLSAHKGTGAGGGNHRGSIFRLIVGEALQRAAVTPIESWGVGQSASVALERLGWSAERLRETEAPLEQEVSRKIGAMPLLWVSTAPDDREVRRRIEAGAIALLSNHGKDAVHPPSPGWLGLRSGREPVRRSGLWNNQHVDGPEDREFLDTLEAAAAQTAALER